MRIENVTKSLEKVNEITNITEKLEESLGALNLISSNMNNVTELFQEGISHIENSRASQEVAITKMDVF